MDHLKAYSDLGFIKNHTFQAHSGLVYDKLFFSEKIYFDPIYCNHQIQRIQQIYSRSLIYALVYVLAIFYGKHWMKNRPAFDLRKELISWNITLAVFSIIGTSRLWPEMIHLWKTRGIEYTYCTYDNGCDIIGCWSAAFIMSKVAELFDTVFIILRKQNLTFLHWYHHASVLIWTWFQTSQLSPVARWFMLLNFTVHAFMYTYYAFRALRFHIPKVVSIILTIVQIVQMVAGIYINVTVFLIKKIRNQPCSVTDESMMFAFLVYCSYFMFFCHFFYLAYLKKTTKQITDNAAKPIKHLKSKKE